MRKRGQKALDPFKAKRKYYYILYIIIYQLKSDKRFKGNVVMSKYEKAKNKYY